MMNRETLKKFCAGAGYPEGITQPWRDDQGYIYSTDGHVIIRVPRCQFEGELPERTVKQKPPDVKVLPWNNLDLPGPRFRIRRETLEVIGRHYRCGECSPDAPISETCKRCGGEGCPRCRDGYKVKRGDLFNTSQCPECSGSQWRRNTVWCMRRDTDRLPGYYLNPAILHLVVFSLENVLFSTPPITIFPASKYFGPIGFRFSNGEGLIMPMAGVPIETVVNEAK